MSSDDRPASGPASDSGEEKKKRRRELLAVWPLAILFLVLTLIEFKLFEISSSLPFVHSIFFFGLVNFNIILFLLLIFLIFRNVVKVFAERGGGLIGSTLKGKLIAAFVAFSFVPTALMFLVSVFYINNSFDKWFSEKVAGVLKSSMEVTNAYYLSAKKKNYHFASQIAQKVKEAENRHEVQVRLERLRKTYSLDAVEYYPDLFGDRMVDVNTKESIPMIPPVSLELLRKGIRQKVEDSTIHHFGEGDLIRVIVPVQREGTTSAVVVSSFVPLSLISKREDINTAYEDFRNVNPLEYPIKSIYLTILVLMTLVILLGATWFGFYLAKQLSVPLEELGAATKRVAKGDFPRVDIVSGSKEINQLIAHFNKMTRVLETSRREVDEANTHLKETLNRLDEHSRYIEVVLSNITTGVVSVDDNGVITMINRHAANLLEIDPQKYVGRRAKDVLEDDYYAIFDDLLETMKQHRAGSIQKEVRINVNGRSIPLQMTLSVLYDDGHRELGKVLVFDDMTPVLSAQRAAAWTEVARRIAHEIKNPLTPIRLSAQRLQKRFGSQIEDPVFSECTSMIMRQVDDLKGLINEFSNFARLPKSKPVVGSLNQTIEEALVLFRSGHSQCEFAFDPDENLPEFKFDPEQMKRVITNLLDNGVAAVSSVEGGRVAITTEYDSLLEIVRITVKDNGMGLPKSLRDRIFEPYITTKEQGTGLGLAIVKRTVEDHNGFIRAFANEPSGTKIVIELPVVRAQASPTLIKSEEQTENEDKGSVT